MAACKHWLILGHIVTASLCMCYIATHYIGCLAVYDWHASGIIARVQYRQTSLQTAHAGVLTSEGFHMIRRFIVHWLNTYSGVVDFLKSGVLTSGTRGRRRGCCCVGTRAQVGSCFHRNDRVFGLVVRFSEYPSFLHIFHISFIFPYKIEWPLQRLRIWTCRSMIWCDVWTKLFFVQENSLGAFPWQIYVLTFYCVL